MKRSSLPAIVALGFVFGSACTHMGSSTTPSVPSVPSSGTGQTPAESSTSGSGESAKALASRARQAYEERRNPASPPTAPGETAVQVGEGTVRYRIYQFVDKDLAKLTFHEGSAKLTDAEKKRIDNYVASTRSQAQVDKYIVAAWSDKEYPPAGARPLPRPDETLASRRADAVKAELKRAGARSVSEYTMTRHPNWLQDVFSTEAAEVKGEARTRVAANPVVEELGRRLREHGGPGSVVIVAKYKGEVAH